MELEASGRRVAFSKELSDLDRFVLAFVEVLNSRAIRYVIVSGYVPILFGRSRTTEDVDVFIGHIGKDAFDALSEKLEKSGLWIINTTDHALAYQMLAEGDSVRVAAVNKAIPNIELKFTNDDALWNDTIEVVVNGAPLVISRIEGQIAFKLYLGAEKDIEDAVYLYELFKDTLDKALLVQKCKALKVLEAMNRYVRQGKEFQEQA